MTRPGISVLIPTRRPGPVISSVLDSVMNQEIDERLEVVIVDSGSSPTDLARIESFPVRLLRISADEFGHGRTRNFLAEQAAGRVLVYLSQDARPASSDWLRTLIAPLSEPQIAGAYARQIPQSSADPLTRFFLSELYGPIPQRRRSKPGARLRFHEIFFSNVSSAIRRDVWERIPFRPDAVMSEDQYWAFDALKLGYELQYVPSARVFHSHRYTLGKLFARNRLSGYSLHGLIGDSPTGIAARGLEYIVREIAYLLQNGHARWLPYMLACELAKSAGFATGSLQALADRTSLRT